MMKFCHLRTHWTPEQAEAVIEFLDELKEVIWTVYAEDICRLHHELRTEREEEYTVQPGIFDMDE